MQNKLPHITRRDFSLSLAVLTMNQSTLAQSTLAQTALAANEQALWRELRNGGYVLLIRHADAPGTFDPPGFKLGVCSTQRNLSEEGRTQSRRLGELIRAQNVAIAQVFSSEWCRCIDTATLAFGADKVQTWPAISSPRGGDEKQKLANLAAVRRRISRASLKTNMVLVTHMFNIQDITGLGAAQGEIVVLRAQDEHLLVVGRIVVA
jgi:phosphohistidine phosphatase SixA